MKQAAIVTLFIMLLASPLVAGVLKHVPGQTILVGMWMLIMLILAAMLCHNVEKIKDNTANILKVIVAIGDHQSERLEEINSNISSLESRRPDQELY